MTRSLAAPPPVAPATRLVGGRYVDGLACRDCDRFAQRHETLTHAAECRGKASL